ncbi:MAG: N-acetylornithine carbamoyltransferase [Candidatus Peregrinibacteria bacterium]|nr:N-acetylornithine carbamoyltransferase [Candidatus Peregrinibacteria bacterium]
MNHLKNFITGMEFSKETMESILESGIQLKAAGGSDALKGDPAGSPERGKVLTTIFYNPSLRTLLSFQTGMQKLSGIANVLDMSQSRRLEYTEGAVMDGSASEHISEFIRVVCSYSDAVAIRKSDFIPASDNSQTLGMSKEEMLSDSFFEQVLRYANKPIINMESNMFHPCQGLADAMTMKEVLGNVSKKKYVLTWAPHPKPLPLATPHSQMIMPALFGMDVILACPKEFVLDANIMKRAEKLAVAGGGSFQVMHDQMEALSGADIVCEKSWLSLEHFGDWAKEKEVRNQYADWQVTSERMAVTNNGKFMHCLPVRRNVEVSDGVLDSTNSLIIQEAENRMWAQMALLRHILS